MPKNVCWFDNSFKGYIAWKMNILAWNGNLSKNSGTLCLAKIPDLENFILQVSHSYGFSPEWIRLCFVRELEVVKPWLQIGQTKGRAPKILNRSTTK